VQAARIRGRTDELTGAVLIITGIAFGLLPCHPIL